MNTQQLSPSTIATLAEWNGWAWSGYNWVYEAGDQLVVLGNKDMSDHFTDPRFLLRLRKKLHIGIHRNKLPMNELRIIIDSDFKDLDKHILTERYHAAADKAAEIIRKLKPDV